MWRKKSNVLTLYLHTSYLSHVRERIRKNNYLNNHIMDKHKKYLGNHVFFMTVSGKAVKLDSPSRLEMLWSNLEDPSSVVSSELSVTI